MTTFACRTLLLVLLLAAAELGPGTARAADDEAADGEGLMSWGVDTSRQSPEEPGAQYFAEVARERHRLGFGARYGSLLGDPALGLEGFWLYSKDLELGLDLHSSSSNLYSKMELDPLVGTAGIHGRTDEAVAFGRFFFGSAFYLGGGLGYRRARTDWQLYELGGDRRLGGETTTTGAVVDVRLGGQWAWTNGWYVGAELAEGTLSLSAASHARRHGATSPELELVAATAENRADAYGRATNWQLLGFTAGHLIK